MHYKSMLQGWSWALRRRLRNATAAPVLLRKMHSSVLRLRVQGCAGTRVWSAVRKAVESRRVLSVAETLPPPPQGGGCTSNQPVMNFIFARRTSFLMWVGAWVGWGLPEPQMTPLPPPPSHICGGERRPSFTVMGMTEGMRLWTPGGLGGGGGGSWHGTPRWCGASPHTRNKGTLGAEEEEWSCQVFTPMRRTGVCVVEVCCGWQMLEESTGTQAACFAAATGLSTSVRAHYPPSCARPQPLGGGGGGLAGVQAEGVSS